MTAPLSPRPWSQIIVTATARKRKIGAPAMRLQAADGLMIQCPRDWRSDLGNGLAYVVTAALRADGACYVVRPSAGYRLAEAGA